MFTTYQSLVNHPSHSAIRGASPFPPDEAWSCWPGRSQQENRTVKDSQGPVSQTEINSEISHWVRDR